MQTHLWHVTVDRCFLVIRLSLDPPRIRINWGNIRRIDIGLGTTCPIERIQATGISFNIPLLAKSWCCSPSEHHNNNISILEPPPCLLPAPFPIPLLYRNPLIQYLATLHPKHDHGYILCPTNHQIQDAKPEGKKRTNKRCSSDRSSPSAAVFHPPQMNSRTSNAAANAICHRPKP
jgi:hypothetical protein